MNYYNENDKGAAQWLRNLIDAKLIPAGHVDDRSIAHVWPSDLKGYTQCHFFAGIGGWPLALQFAGWPDDRPVWTGSCPCQPFSAAGKRKGEADERHLWPEMHRLIAECRPATCFGEQVASDDGCQWLAGVFADLEALEYRVAGADLCAAGAGAPHIRQRLVWVADAGCTSDEHGLRSGAASCEAGPHAKEAQQRKWRGANTRRSGGSLGLGDANHTGRKDAVDHGTDCARRESAAAPAARLTSEVGNHGWRDYATVQCRVPKGGPPVARRVEPGTFPVAHGVPSRVVKLRAYGNAIVPQVAAEFVRAFMETEAA